MVRRLAWLAPRLRGDEQLSERLWPAWPQAGTRVRNAAALATVYSNWSISGSGGRAARPERVFARRFADFIGREHCVPTSSGSSAILIALQALGVGPGDLVILPATTWVGCATAVLRSGASPRFADTTLDTLLGDPWALSCQPAAILVVHTYASRSDVTLWRQRFPGVPIIEDCSHCHGGYAGTTERLGRAGDIAVFSFQASKLLTSGEGGCAVTDDDHLAKRMAALRADSRIYDEAAGGHKLVPGDIHGANHAMSELHAALLSAALPDLDDTNARRASGVAAFLARVQNDRVNVVADRRALLDGAFYGLPVLLDETDPDAVRDTVLRQTGASLDRCYPPVPISPLYQLATNRSYARPIVAEDVVSRASEAWRSLLIVPHWYFLAESEALERLADACSGSRDSSVDSPRRARSRAAAPPVTVVVLTHNRPESLERALKSVYAQNYGGEIRVTVIVDGKGITPDRLRSLTRNRDVSVVAVDEGVLRDASGIARVARLRNLAVPTLTTPLVAFLDDDNEWTQDHLSSLWVAMAAARAPAAHSWRTLVDRLGSPHIPDTFPWASDSDAPERYNAAVSVGLFEVGSPIVRDTAAAIWKGRDVGMVDMGEWLFRTELLETVRFEHTYSERDALNVVGEDDKLLAALKDAGVPIAKSGKATLLYTVGGLSNAAESRSASTNG